MSKDPISVRPSLGKLSELRWQRCGNQEVGPMS